MEQVKFQKATREVYQAPELVLIQAEKIWCNGSVEPELDENETPYAYF